MKRLLKAGLFCTGLMLAGATLAHASVNLLTNPGFDDGGGTYAGYFTFGAGVQMSTAATDNIFRSGVAAAKIYGGFNGCPNAPVFNVGGFGQAKTPVVGQTYSFSGASFVSSADSIPGTATCSKNRCIAKLVFFDALSGGNEIVGDEQVIGDGNTVKDRWNPFFVSAVCPANAKRVEALILYLQPGCDPGSVFIDELELRSSPTEVEPNALVNGGFTSALTGWNTFGNVYSDTRPFTVHTATGAAKMFSTFVIDSPSGMYQTLAASAGQTWKFSVWVRNTCQESPITGTNDNFMLGRIVFRNSSGLEIGSQDMLVADKTTPLGHYTKRVTQAVAPPGTVSAQAYLLFISPTLQGGAFFLDDANFHRLDIVGVDQSPLSARLEFAAPSPNPARQSTRLSFTLPATGDVEVGIFDIAGRSVVTLHKGSMQAGSHSLVWDGLKSDGTQAANGVYRAVVRTSDERQSRSIVLSR
ncbi:MAG: T9SS type A sorting domain-containing protein [Candidatus Eisenbacteria bacterium]|uniref:T9SS type A sorting domain-containing protein n=1 Tax=Eiseniibacteriota bacterium TaxID=2212470 RepID=A0A933SB08_UNCEI|nr:T9SS type A sorting domain-containing protein [Candidatus Eisenbacteria bacterium]